MAGNTLYATSGRHGTLTIRKAFLLEEKVETISISTTEDGYTLRDVNDLDELIEILNYLKRKIFTKESQ